MLHCEDELELTDLYYEPVNLIDRPLLSVTGILSDVFTDMPCFVIKLPAYHAITEPTASLLEDDTSPTDDLNSIHDQSLDNSKLTITYRSTRKRG